MMNRDAYPLCWPENWPRIELNKRERSRFKVTPDRARKLLLKEIGRLVGYKYKRQDVIISTDLRLRNDGEIYASQRQPEDQGVAVYFTYKGNSMVFACDRWNIVHDNIHSIGKTIQALRGIERWGASDMLEKAFTGFKALNPAKVDDWRIILKITVKNNSAETLEHVERSFRRLAHDVHPDKEGGSNDAFYRLTQARDRARKELGA